VRRHLVWSPEGHDVLRTACGRQIDEHNAETTTRRPGECDCLLCQGATRPFKVIGDWALSGYHYRADPRPKE
jgi:hypothetical protein